MVEVVDGDDDPDSHWWPWLQFPSGPADDPLPATITVASRLPLPSSVPKARMWSPTARPARLVTEEPTNFVVFVTTTEAGVVELATVTETVLPEMVATVPRTERPVVTGQPLPVDVVEVVDDVLQQGAPGWWPDGFEEWPASALSELPPEWSSSPEKYQWWCSHP